MDEYLMLTHGDGVTVETYPESGEPAVRIQNKAFVEEPRWIVCDVISGDRNRYIDELIQCLIQLRHDDGRYPTEITSTEGR